MEIKIINISENPLPEYQTVGSSGLDLRANLKIPFLLKSLERTLIKTGLFIALPSGYEAQIRPRSGLAIKNGITILNAPGTIDADYRGEIGVILINLSNETFEINNGDRIAQLVVTKFKKITWKQTDSLETTKRGSHGLGSTGK